TSVIDNSDQEIANEKSIEVFHSPDLISYQIDEKPQEILEPRTLPKIPIRNFFLWLGLGLVSFGIFYLVYLYLNIEDLEKHSKYPNEPKAEDIDISATKILMLFLVSICFGFIPILWWIFYKKYAGFYNHIKNQSRENAPHKIPHPAYYMTLVIISNLLALVPAILTFFEINLRVSYPGIFWLISSVLIALSIGIIILDYFWQRAFNSHSKITMKKHNILSVEQTTLNNGA
ncbi:MAG: DUF4234 domain-containing protein, partial [Asgard group archaeon]|nr:DUF4234 domain-containing protein [Asgard group archaeon]